MRIQNFFNDPVVKEVTTYGVSFASAYALWAEKPTWWNAIKATMNVMKETADRQEIWAQDFFYDDSKWVEPFASDFNGAIFKILNKFPATTSQTSSDNLVVRIHDVEGIEFGYILNQKIPTRIQKIFCHFGSIDEARALLQRKLWEQFSGKSLVMCRSQTFAKGFADCDEDKVTFELDDQYEPMISQLSSDYHAYLKRCIDANVNRSVMFYGPPGTGKSTTAKTIINLLGLRSLRIRVSDAGGFETSTLFEAITIFEPDAIILDDFDRAHNQQALLEVLEYFQKNVKLVIATVNRRDNLDEALLRPGRFDELILVKSMDAKIVKTVLGKDNEDIYEKVKNWPIAFIQEYVKRRQFMNKDEAITSIEELADRVNRLSLFEEQSDSNLILEAKKKSLSKTKKCTLSKKQKDEIFTYVKI